MRWRPCCRDRAGGSAGTGRQGPGYNPGATNVRGPLIEAGRRSVEFPRHAGWQGGAVPKTVAIVQSSYIPWKGYFDLIRAADEFIFFDDTQYTRRDWRNRNRIKTHGGLHWLSIPVRSKGQYLSTIKDMVVADSGWAQSHWTGYKQVALSINKTSSSHSTYDLRRKVVLFVNSVTSFSDRPLVFIFYVGAAILALSTVAAGYLIVRRLFFGILLGGWPSLIVSVWMLGGLTLFCLGIVAIYLSKVFIDSCISNRHAAMVAVRYGHAATRQSCGVREASLASNRSAEGRAVYQRRRPTARLLA
jgi:hypothetical protein